MYISYRMYVCMYVCRDLQQQETSLGGLKEDIAGLKQRESSLQQKLSTDKSQTDMGFRLDKVRAPFLYS